MNRAQRRAYMKQAKKEEKMAQQVENLPIQITPGHNEDKVILIFNQAINNLQLTPAQAEKIIGDLRVSMQKLAEYQACKRETPGLTLDKYLRAQKVAH